jgi:MYXO-CTERM domain-containing protein
MRSMRVVMGSGIAVVGLLASSAWANDFKNPGFDDDLNEWRPSGTGVTVGQEDLPDGGTNKFGQVGPGADPVLRADFACGEPDTSKQCRIRFRYKFTLAAGENEVFEVFDTGGRVKLRVDASTTGWVNGEVLFDDCGPQTITIQVRDPDDGDTPETEQPEESTAGVDDFRCECVARTGDGPPPPPKKKGCGGCTTGGAGAGWPLALLVAGLLLARRRSRRS